MQSASNAADRHRGYPLVIERLPDDLTITGIDTQSTAFFNPDPPFNFDLT